MIRLVTFGRHPAPQFASTQAHPSLMRKGNLREDPFDAAFLRRAFASVDLCGQPGHLRSALMR